jgi:hypothetical protein
VADDGSIIDVGGLLTIDVGSELRKLSQAQLQGPWQIPAELVRRALRSGASEVEVRTERHGVRVIDDGAGVPTVHLQWAAMLLDTRRPNEERHAALTALESGGGLVLLAMAGLGPRQLRVESIVDGVHTVLEYERGRSPWIEQTSGIAGRHTEVRLRSTELDRRQMAFFVNNVCRFAPASVKLDGRPIPPGFERALVQASLADPLRGGVAIPIDGETAHVWLLEHGLVTGHVTVPEAPCFEAAVELGSDATDLNPARLRDTIAPYVSNLVEQAAGLLARLGASAAVMPEPVRARTARLVLQGIRRRLQIEALARSKIFRVVDGKGPGFADLIDLRDASHLAPGGTRTLTALYPNQRPERYALGNTPVLIADAVERSRLAEIMNVRFRPPDPRDASGSWASSLQRLADSAGRGLVRLFARVRHPLRSPPIPDVQLQPHERAFVEHLRAHLGAGQRSHVHGVQLCRGTGPIRRTAGPSSLLLLPRDNPLVAAAIAAINHDPKWVYPAALALLEGRGLPSLQARSTWLARGPA